jgi:hypothetical protein
VGRRRSVHVVHRVAGDGGETPNRYIPEITVDIRVHFPPNASRRDALIALHDASDLVQDKLDSLPDSGCVHTDTWFSRSICQEPACGSMHDICSDCGVVVGECAL